MRKLLRHIFRSTIFLAIIFTGLSAAAGEKNTSPPGGKHSPVISEKVRQAAGKGGMVAVLIKLKEEWEHPAVKKMATASDPAHFISKGDIRKLQKSLESSFTPEETRKDINIIHRLESIPWITGRINRQALEKLKVHPNVAAIEADARVKAHLAESGPLINADVSRLAGYTGSGATVAVLDTGIDTDHPDLQGDLVREECFLFWGGCPTTGTTRASGPGSAEDGDGHGTHVSGIITSGNATYRGIAPDAKIVAIKVLDDDGYGWLSDVATALDWVAANKDAYGIGAVNMSLGSNLRFSGICDASAPASAEAADAAKAAGVVLFASSGNDGASDGLAEPACLSSVISVGSVYDANGSYFPCLESTSADKISCFSNVSPVLDLLAPGAVIISLAPGGGIDVMSGTSMASPHAAATAALLIQKNPFLTPDDIQNLLINTGVFLYDDRIDMSFPRIDAAGALDAAPDSTAVLTLAAAGTGSGTVAGAGIYNYRAMAAVTATPDYGSAFTGWSGPDAVECTAGAVSMTTDKSCTATFTIDNCPDDPLKIEPGVCGCGVADTDTDTDGTLDCNDLDDDNDGMPDDYEISKGFNPLSALDANGDPDNDGLSNLYEYNLGADPFNIDTDNDGVVDGFDRYPLDDQQNACLPAITNDITAATFFSLEDAIGDENAQDRDLIKITAIHFNEDILYNRNFSLILSGGYYCSYAENPLQSAINSLIIRDGTVIPDKITIKAQP